MPEAQVTEGPVSDAYLAILRGTPRTGPAHIADHTQARKPIQFRAFEIDQEGVGSKVQPLNATNPAPLLEPPKTIKGISTPKVAAMPVPTLIPVANPEIADGPAETGAAPIMGDAQMPAEVRSATAPPTVIRVEVPAPPPQPKVMVEFVGDVADIPIPCFEVNQDTNHGFLSLVVPSTQKLKLEANKEFKIRIGDSEKFYWFTGIAVQLTVLNAMVLVFGIPAPEEP